MVINNDQEWRQYTHHTASKTSRHQGKPDKQEQSRPPNSSRISESFISSNPILVDKVDNEVAEQRTDARNPVDERDVHGGFRFRYGTVGCFGVSRENGSVQKCPVRKGKLTMYQPNGRQAGVLKPTKAPARYTPTVRRCFPRVNSGNGFKHTLLGS